MKPNSLRGYQLENAAEINAALRSAQRTGNQDLADLIIRSKEEAPLDGRIGYTADLDRQASKEMIRSIEEVVETGLAMHPSELATAERMLDQHRAGLPSYRRFMRAVLAPQTARDVLSDSDFRAAIQN